MNDFEFKNLKESSWQRRLTVEEEAQLQAHMVAHPEAEADWREEIQLNQLLNQLRDAPLSSNFTSQVLRAIELEEVKISREKRGWPAWRVGFGWVSRLAIAGILFLGISFFSIQLQQHLRNQLQKRAEFAHSVEIVSQVAVLPTEWLENFDTISRMDRTAPADEELLAALK